MIYQHLKNMTFRWAFLLFNMISFLSCQSEKENYRDYLDISGEWQLALDSSGVGEKERWFLSELGDNILLPGTTDLRQKGIRNSDTTTMHLNRPWKYEGIAWYKKEVNIPENFADRHLNLFLERTKPTKVWIDSVLVGSSRLLQSPHRYNVTTYLTPGIHYITVMVNNDLTLTPYGNVHIYSDDTQTNWNGILGEMYIESSDLTHITNLQVYPDIHDCEIDITLEVENPKEFTTIDVNFKVEKKFKGKTTRLDAVSKNLTYDRTMKLTYDLGEDCSLWDEYDQPLYTFIATIDAGDHKDQKAVPFSMREFTVEGTQFAMNGRTTFLRGKHEAAVFPQTGYPPMEIKGWQRVYREAKKYGINHYRFHSYCPPEAAFTAADMEGIYLQPELPFWGGLESDSVAQMQLEEGYALLKAYANHPSFILFSHGNEIWSGHDRVETNILALKKADPRPIYTMGCNNNIGYVPPRACSEFFVGARTPSEGDTILTHTRLTHAFADSRDGGILNTSTPNTIINFDYPVSQMNIPIISHEIGQYQIYPDYREIEKYTGVLHPWNLETFQQRLQEKGMGNMDSIFQQATGAWSAICYKAEMEAALRTGGLAGFQLLDLQDFPGQGTALVGILDAFMDSKGVITPQEWKQSCNDVVLLASFPKYCWTADETFVAAIQVANYSNKDLTSCFNWTLKDGKGKIISEGDLPEQEIHNEGLISIGKLEVELDSLKVPDKVLLTLTLPDTEYKNVYPFWIYPTVEKVVLPEEILVTEQLDKSVMNALQSSEKVLLFPKKEDIADNSFDGHFPPEFWNYGMFKGISEWVKKPISPGTLGLLSDPDHPIFRSFPTDIHTHWQWYSIVKASSSLILDNTPHNYLPIVQVVDNLERNHKLGMIFEFKVREGKLLVCTAPLHKMTDIPEANQLYWSIIQYVESEDFNPDCLVSEEKLEEFFYSK